MIYKTLTLQIYKPGRKKREIMDKALLSYARALQSLLTRCRVGVCELAASGRAVSKSQFLSLASPAALRELNPYEVEPFKDSIKMELAALAEAYLAQSRRNPAANYPCVYEEPGQTDALLSALCDGSLDGRPDRLEREYLGTLRREQRCHPLYFGRYDTCRDFCLLYDEFTGRFYAKLYLLNAKNSIHPEGRSWRLRLRYISNKQAEFSPSSGPERFLILPLAFGQPQLSDLKRALENPSILRTARLIKRNGQYYLLVNVECGAKRTVPTKNVMGVARGGEGLSYSVCSSGGKTLSQGEITSQAAESQRIFALAKEITRLAGLYSAQTVMEADGGYRDGLNGSPLSIAQYRRLVQIVSYKLPEAGLPKPILVSAKGLYSTCPECFCRTSRNRPSERLFACVECGYASEAKYLGSLNLARMPSRYQTDKIPVYTRETDKGILCYNKTLAFERLLPLGCRDFSQVYYELSLLARGENGFEADRKRYAMLQKLRDAANIRDAVRIAPGRTGRLKALRDPD